MATIKEINARLLRELNFELVNCDSFMEKFYHYCPLGRVEEMLKNEKLTFVNPAKWSDPYEELYLNTDFSPLGYKRPKKIFCFCARNSTDNEEASWKVYSNGVEPTIRIKFNIEKLFLKINEFAQKHNCKVYYSMITYNLFAKNLREISEKEKYYNYYLSTPFDDAKYIRLMSLKRPAFEYEKEYRLFIALSSASHDTSENGILKIPIDKDVFQSFTIYPLERIHKETIDDTKTKKTKMKELDLKSSIKEQAYKAQKKAIEKFIQKYAPNATVYSSNLYGDIKLIERIEPLSRV